MSQPAKIMPVDFFVYTDKHVTKARKECEDWTLTPMPEFISRSGDKNAQMCWDVFFQMVCILKKRLRDLCRQHKPTKDRKLINGEIIFALKFDRGNLTFVIKQHWVAQLLNIQNEIRCHDPWVLYNEVVVKNQLQLT